MEITGYSKFAGIKKIDGLSPTQTDQPGIAPTEKKGNGVSFGDFLKNQLEEVNRLGIESNKAIERNLDGTDPNPHTAMIAVQKADISFKLMLSVKEKLIQAYEQIVRTPIG